MAKDMSRLIVGEAWHQQLWSAELSADAVKWWLFESTRKKTNSEKVAPGQKVTQKETHLHVIDSLYLNQSIRIEFFSSSFNWNQTGWIHFPETTSQFQHLICDICAFINEKWLDITAFCVWFTFFSLALYFWIYHSRGELLNPFGVHLKTQHDDEVQKVLLLSLSEEFLISDTRLTWLSESGDVINGGHCLLFPCKSCQFDVSFVWVYSLYY